LADESGVASLSVVQAGGGAGIGPIDPMRDRAGRGIRMTAIRRRGAVVE
jgi:hypothetical protein